jgi:hypothetical protein
VRDILPNCTARPRKSSRRKIIKASTVGHVLPHPFFFYYYYYRDGCNLSYYFLLNVFFFQLGWWVRIEIDLTREFDLVDWLTPKEKCCVLGYLSCRESSYLIHHSDFFFLFFFLLLISNWFLLLLLIFGKKEIIYLNAHFLSNQKNLKKCVTCGLSQVMGPPKLAGFLLV